MENANPVDHGLGRVVILRRNSMNNSRLTRVMKTVRWLASGAILLQAGGCDFTTINEIAQTVFLGITAAGSIAILQNI